MATVISDGVKMAEVVRIRFYFTVRLLFFFKLSIGHYSILWIVKEPLVLFFWVWVRKWCDRVYWTAIESTLEDGDDNVDIHVQC